MNLSEWARRNGHHPKNANRWFHEGKLPEGVVAERLPSGGIHVRTQTHEDIDVVALVAALEEAGYVVFTKTEAARLGVRR